MTREEKERQIKKEARATAILFAICFIWHVGFGYLLSGSGIKLFGLPLWWILSTPGVFVVAVVGVIYLLKKVFVNFSLDDDDETGKEA
ncbi:MAG: YhdT family protein [Eubacterium sp.]|nr:YhdT family protein [Eubacterium sp.]